MAKLIDLSKLRKEDIPIVSLTGTVYLIPGNFPSEFAVKLNETYQEMEKAQKKNDTKKVYAILKQWTFDLISMNKSGKYVDDTTGETVEVTKKPVTMETVDEEFNDYKVLELLLNQILAIVNETFSDYGYL